ncbi:hypothetical protein HZ996_07230 [Cryomorphaceae bacterium]|nr:hypothetical protein HZ996_07230 [Cryomorphaceae bacterium]
MDFTLTNALLVLAIDAFGAYLVGRYQKAQGLSFGKTFAQALIGFIGLSAIVWKLFLY